MTDPAGRVRGRITPSEVASGRPRPGAVAQWSERGTHNPLVVGSIPTRPTSFLTNDTVFRQTMLQTRVHDFG